MNRVLTFRTPNGGEIRAFRARSLWQKTRGLLARPEPRPCEALLLAGWPSIIHTVGMRYPIDVVWLDRHNVITRLRTLDHGCLLAHGGARATAVLEMREGESVRLDLHEGDRLFVLPARAMRQSCRPVPVAGDAGGTIGGYSESGMNFGCEDATR